MSLRQADSLERCRNVDIQLSIDGGERSHGEDGSEDELHGASIVETQEDE